MKIYPHSSPHLQIRPSLVHPFLPQDKLHIQMHLNVPCNAWAILLVVISDATSVQPLCHSCVDLSIIGLVTEAVEAEVAVGGVEEDLRNLL